MTEKIITPKSDWIGLSPAQRRRQQWAGLTRDDEEDEEKDSTASNLSQSSLELRSSSGESPQVSRRKRLWQSFKKSSVVTRFRSRSREKIRKSSTIASPSRKSTASSDLSFMDASTNQRTMEMTSVQYEEYEEEEGEESGAERSRKRAEHRGSVYSTDGAGSPQRDAISDVNSNDVTRSVPCSPAHKPVTSGFLSKSLQQLNTLSEEAFYVSRHNETSGTDINSSRHLARDSAGKSEGNRSIGLPEKQTDSVNDPQTSPNKNKHVVIMDATDANERNILPENDSRNKARRRFRTAGILSLMSTRFKSCPERKTNALKTKKWKMSKSRSKSSAESAHSVDDVLEGSKRSSMRYQDSVLSAEERESEVDSGIAVGDLTEWRKVYKDEVYEVIDEDEILTLSVHEESTVLRQRHTALREHAFFQLDVTLKEGTDLVVRDSCGTSDPYVKFKIGHKQLYKSRIVFKNLNPQWDESFTLPIDDVFKPLRVCVYDYDRGLNDDPMGSAEIDLTSLELDVLTDLKLDLFSDKKSKHKKETNMGYISLSCTLIPKSEEDKEQYFKRSMKEQAPKKVKTQIWNSVLTIVLVEGRGLMAMDDNGFSDPYVKFRLGNEKYKSKYKTKTLTPRWLEQFDLHMFDDQTSLLEIAVWDHDVGGKDDIMGRATLDLSQMEREVTHRLDQELEDGAGVITLLLTISGTAGSETISDLANYTSNPLEREQIVSRYGLLNSLKSAKDVGWLQVKVIKARDLLAADIGGKSDPFCVLELVNSRLQTNTEYKTLYPEWGKVFTFNVKDIHSVLEVTVYDEDRDKKAEFLGKIAVPLLRIRNGERKWYALKDKKLLARSKGAIQLEMDVIFSHVRAAIRTFNPREEKYMQPEPKFKIAVLKRNIDRVSKLVQAGVESGKFLQSCFDWESKPRSITAFAVFLILVWNFELYLIPVTLLLIFFKNLLVVQIAGNLLKDKDEDEYVDEEEDDDEEDKDSKHVALNHNFAEYDPHQEEKKGFREKLAAVQDVCLQVQEGMDMAASLGERVKNTFNWTVPWLSWLLVFVLSIATVILYNIPLRIIIMLWGINKFTKKLRAPNAIPNNELIDYLSRVPSDKELYQARELRPDPVVGSTKKKRS